MFCWFHVCCKKGSSRFCCGAQADVFFGHPTDLDPKRGTSRQTRSFVVDGPSCQTRERKGKRLQHIGPVPTCWAVGSFLDIWSLKVLFACFERPSGTHLDKEHDQSCAQRILPLISGLLGKQSTLSLATGLTKSA